MSFVSGSRGKSAEAWGSPGLRQGGEGEAPSGLVLPHAQLCLKLLLGSPGKSGPILETWAAER